MSKHKPKKPNHPAADRRWTLLFIGGHGNVITLKHFKAVVIGIGSLFFCAVIFATAILFQHKGTLKQNKDLRKRFTESEKQIEKLRHEKEILMARLVRAEAKTKDNLTESPQITQKMMDPQPAAPLPQVVLNPKPEPAKAVEEKAPVPQAALPTPAPRETEETEPDISVALENFKVWRETGDKNLNAEFKIKNTSQGTEPLRVTGRVVIVLKGDDLRTAQWLVMPAVGLAGDKPSGKRGKSFSILRFRTMNFTSEAPSYSDQFETAVVYVFTKTGELLLEQDFSVNLPPARVVSRVAPSAQTDSGEATSSLKGSSETPESGDATNSLNDIPSVW